jgi:hypothetical protein
MKRIPGYFLLVTISILTILIIFTACSKPQSIKTNTHNDKALRIGIIGETPKVVEEKVTFGKIKFSDLEKDTVDSQYDAIFITKYNLSEASQGKYADIYKKSKIPFFFIQTEKSYVPFTEKDLTYDNAPKFTDQSYATGIMYNGNKLNFWGYGLYNDIENQANIKDVYSRIFETISQNTMPN